MSDVKWSKWIEWGGGECPVAEGSKVSVKYRDGDTNSGVKAGISRDSSGDHHFRCAESWDHLGSPSDIIAYRYKIEEPSGISEADEEECIQLAYERMNEESVKVSIEELQDNVNKPKHYQLREGYEVYDLRQDLAAKAANGGATYDQYSDWDRAIEYIIRMWGKNRLEDAKKGRWYLDKLIEKLEAQ